MTGVMRMRPFVDVEDLIDRYDEVVACDVRWDPSGGPTQEAFRGGHLPGAVHVDLDRDLAGPASSSVGRHPLPAPEVLATTLGRLGIAADDRVVAYDAGVGALAARLVWMLRVLGQPAALLDGGLDAWCAAGGVVEQGPPEPRRQVTVPVRAWSDERIVDADGAAAAPVVLDARDAARYRGEDAGPDARAGRIPGARHAPFTANVDERGRLLGDDELRAIYTPLLGDDEPVSSCGSGVTACHDLLVLEHLGLGPGRLYPGSWSQWAADTDRPIETG